MNHTSWLLEDFLADESFVNYCYGCNVSDIEYWEMARKQDAELALRMDRAKEMCLLLSVRVSEGEKQRDWAILEQRMGVKAPVRRMWVRRVAIAAAIILLMGAGWMWMEKNGGGRKGLYATEQFSMLAASGFEGRKTVELPDGSEVLLNAFSELKIAPDFNKDNRRIELRGEAFFQVKENPGKPFIVVTGNTAVTVLGTSFKVRNYGSDQHCSVMLDAGKVSVESIDGKKPFFKEILLPGDQMVVQNDNTFNRGKFDEGDLQKWMKGQLVFKEAGLKEINDRLHDLFGVAIVASARPGDPILFTGSFDGKGLKEILDAVGFTNNFTYTISHDTVTLKY